MRLPGFKVLMLGSARICVYMYMYIYMYIIYHMYIYIYIYTYIYMTTSGHFPIRLELLGLLLSFKEDM